MKILYVALKYEYGNPARGFSFEHQNFYDTLTKMNRGEHQVIYFPIDEKIKEHGPEEMNRRLLEVVYKEKPDFCFFCLFGEEIKKETIGEITQKSGAVTFNWFTDDHWKFYNFSKYWAPYFSWVATTDPEAINKYYKSGYKNVIHTQWACNHFLCKPLGLEKIYDVTFLGQPHGNRKKIIEKLRSSGVNVQCWGWGWPNGSISPEEMVRLFSQSKINLGLTNSSMEGIIKSFGRIFLEKGVNNKIRLVNPKYWMDNVRAIMGKRKSQLKGRNYDIPGCGSFLLTQDADDLRSRYKDGEEIIIFKDAQDLIKKIKYYLAHEEEREKIAAAGYNRTIKEHTYEKRFEEIFKIIGLT